MQPEVALPSSASRERALQRVWKLQGYGLLLVLFLTFFPPLFHVQEDLFFIFLAIAFGAAWVERTSIWVRTPIDLPLSLFVLWVLLTVPFATDPSYSFTEWRKLGAQVLVFYWALLVFKKSGPELSRSSVVQAVLLGAVILCAYAVSDFIGRGGSWKDRYIRAAAPSSDYNWLSTYLVIALPILVADGIARQDRWRRIASWTGAGVAFAGQVIAYTRAAWLAMVVQGLVWGWLTGRRRWAWGLVGLSMLVAIGLVAASKMGYQQGTVDPWTWNARLSSWKLGLGKTIEHPIVGVGYGNYTFMMLFGALPETEKAPGIHSLFLMLAMGSGIPALAFLVWTFSAAFLSLVRSARRSLDRHATVLMVAVAVMIVGFAIRNIFDYMFAGSLAYLFWIVLAAGFDQSQASIRAGPLDS